MRHDPPCNMIIEIRVADPRDPSIARSTAWTIMPLYNPAGEPNFGRWRLPVYRLPTKLDVEMKEIPS